MIFGGVPKILGGWRPKMLGLMISPSLEQSIGGVLRPLPPLNYTFFCRRFVDLKHSMTSLLDTQTFEIELEFREDAIDGVLRTHCYQSQGVYASMACFDECCQIRGVLGVTTKGDKK